MEVESELSELGSGIHAHNRSATLEKATTQAQSVTTSGLTVVAHTQTCLEYQELCAILLQFLMEHFTAVFKCSADSEAVHPIVPVLFETKIVSLFIYVIL